MKTSLSIFGTIIATAALLSLQACKPPRPQSGDDDGSSSGPGSQSGVFPFDRNLISADQRAVTGTVLGKQGNRIAFRRTADQAEFLIAINTLSASDQAFLNKLADGNIGEIAKIEAVAAKPGKTAQRRARWTESYDRGLQESKKERLPMYLLFTGSDWCPPCQELEKRVLRSKEFQAFADENLVLVRLDFPRSGSGRGENKQLQSKFNVSTFPTVILNNSDGHNIARLQGFGRSTPEEYVYKLKQAIKN